MIKPPVPVDELLRLETLRNLKLLDTNPEERFDRITRLAKKLFGTSIVLVSLVDRNRQWFKSRQGLDATETPREISFCGHAILNDEVLVVADAKDDERFVDNPLVTGDPDIRFYAGCPLSAPDGHKVGTLCLIDSKPRGMTADELDLLRELGAMVEDELVIAGFLNVDPTTGLSNRTGFTMIGDHLLAMCRRNDVPASLLLFHRKEQGVTDVATSSDQSDRAAVEMTQLLRATFRESDIIGRLSADHFVALLSGTRRSDITNLLQRFLSNVDKRNELVDNGCEIKIDSYAVLYQADQHQNTEVLIQSAEAQLEQSAVEPVAEAPAPQCANS